MTKERLAKVWRPTGGFGGGAWYHPTQLSFAFTLQWIYIIHPDPDSCLIYPHLAAG
jgi:hypothetical protein